jgi:multidrug/hemolysin transport system permease protein
MLIKRNILLFFRDKSNVFFSLLAVFIIIALYALFLGDVMVDSLSEIPTDFVDAPSKLGMIAAGMMLSGMVAVTSVTGCLGSMSVVISDKMAAYKDFATSPVKRSKTAFSYIIGSAACSGIMTVAALILSLAYMIILGGSMPNLASWGKIILTILLSVLCGNSLIYLVTTFIKTTGAFSSVSIVTGTLIGFLMGIYIPIGQLPVGVGWVIKCFPMSHAASMFKLAILGSSLQQVFPNDAVRDGINHTFGVTFMYGTYESNFWFSALVLVVFSILFFGIALLIEHNRKKS